jgi:hypothetical protein
LQTKNLPWTEFIEVLIFPVHIQENPHKTRADVIKLIALLVIGGIEVNEISLAK